MSFENKNLRCRDCKFWWPIAEGEQEPTRRTAIFGECHCEAPPVFVMDALDRKTRYASWAATRREDWCGRHVRLESL